MTAGEEKKAQGLFPESNYKAPLQSILRWQRRKSLSSWSGLVIDNEQVVGTTDGRYQNYWSHSQLARKMGDARQYRLVEFKI